MHKEIADKINSAVSSAAAKVNEPENHDHSITVSANDIHAVCEHLKSDGFNVLHVISAVDYPEKNHIELSYMLSDYTENRDLTLKIEVSRDGAKVDTVSDVWKAADWQEREAYDMIGVTFNNHPDHRRILCPDDWEGHPLKKDYVVQKVYNGMTVNPEEKINSADHFFGKKLINELGDPKRVSWSWKDNDGAEEDSAEA